MKTTYLTVCAAVATLALATTGVMAQEATHPSENYPGKGGSQSAGTTNASPEALNPATGQQSTPPGQTSPSQEHSYHNQ